jgi:hypothetical protein
MKTLKTDLPYIHINIIFLSQSKPGKDHTHLLSKTIKYIKDIQDKPNKIEGSEADAVKQVFRSCFSKNKGFKIMCDIS